MRKLKMQLKGYHFYEILKAIHVYQSLTPANKGEKRRSHSIHFPENPHAIHTSITYSWENEHMLM